MRFIPCAFLIWLAAVCGSPAGTPFSAAIPFEDDQGLLWVAVQSPRSHRPLHFLFDTGAVVSVVNAGTAVMLGLHGGRKIPVRGVEATLTGHWPVKLTATAGNLTLPAKYLSLDLSRLALACGRPLDGLLGADFIRGRVVEIDFKSHELRFSADVSPAKSDTVLRLVRRHGCFCAPVGVNGQPEQWMRLDTGCASALQWVASGTSAKAESARPAIGLAACTLAQAETKVSLGGNEFEQVPTGLHRRAIFAGESGLLGNGLLHRFKTVTIDAKSLRLVLTPM